MSVPVVVIRAEVGPVADGVETELDLGVADRAASLRVV
jgi:hypothetical protein